MNSLKGVYSKALGFSEGMFAIGGEGTDIRPPLQDDPRADLQIKTFLRPALRADLPLTSFLSVYATYGLQFEDINAKTSIDAGRLITQTYTTTCDTSSPSNCTPQRITKQAPEVGNNTDHHRDWHSAATVGVDLYGSDLVSLHVEYLPERNGHIGSVIAGASWHW